MKKFNDLEKKDRDNLREVIDISASLAGQESWNTKTPHVKYSDLKSRLGICHDCIHLAYCRTEFGTIYAKCTELEIIFNANDRMTECNVYSRRGQMSLDDMLSLATIIEIKKREIGF